MLKFRIYLLIAQYSQQKPESDISEEWEYNHATNQWIKKTPKDKKKQEVNYAYLDASLRRKEDKATGTVTENYGDDLMR